MSKTCECIEETNKLLAEHNTELGFHFLMNRETGGVNQTVRLVTNIIEKKRGARPLAIVPTFCPFCGQRYAPEADR